MRQSLFQTLCKNEIRKGIFILLFPIMSAVELRYLATTFKFPVCPGTTSQRGDRFMVHDRLLTS
jgi:hypothetical protein